MPQKALHISKSFLSNTVLRTVNTLTELKFSLTTTNNIKANGGTWKYDINNPELPQKIRPEGGGWYILSDNTFSEFSNKTGLGKNYNSYTEFKFLNGNKNPIKKIVLFEFN